MCSDFHRAESGTEVMLASLNELRSFPSSLVFWNNSLRRASCEDGTRVQSLSIELGTWDVPKEAGAAYSCCALCDSKTVELRLY
ncbi:DNA repair protein XRCC2 isoform X3 [Manis javanica]|uniref:DNA repair protein XRCC2 isoform X3 n=1 Tax=Manis javanica TaxID=9974 RepID=UPI003C6D6A8A